MNKLLNNEVDMLKGNINRMCVTSDLDELDKMYEFALKRLKSIYIYKKHLLKLKRIKHE